MLRRLLADHIASSADLVWRVAVVVSFGASILKSGGLGGILGQLEWNILQFGPILLATVSIASQRDRAILRKGDSVLAWALAAFVAAALLSTISSISRQTTIFQSGILALMTAFVVLTFTRRWNRRECVESDLLLIFAVIVANQFLGLSAGILGAKWAVGDYSRFVGTLSNANYAGMLSATGLAIGFYFVLRMRGRYRFGIGSAMAILVISLLWSGSRGSVVAVCVGAVLVLVLLRAWRVLAASLVVLAALVAGFLAFAPALLSRVSSGDLTSGRVAIYEAMLRNWAHSPILGTGFRTTELIPGNNGLAGHDIFLSVLSETGVVGILAFLLTLVAVVVCGRRNTLAGAAATVVGIELTESSIYGWGGPTATLAWLVLIGYAALGRFTAVDDGTPARRVDVSTSD